MELQTFQDSRGCTAGAAACAKAAALRIRRYDSFRERAVGAVASAHTLLSPSLICFSDSEHLCQRIDGNACARRACCAGPFTTERNACRAAHTACRETELGDGSQR